MKTGKPTISTFGETMLRVSPKSIGERLHHANDFTVQPGGSESNVAIALSRLGHESRFLTRLPQGPLAEKIMQNLMANAVDTSYIARGGQRLGLYFAEMGTGPRNSEVLYDRQGSAFSEITLKDINWKSALSGVQWFHTSGITPAVSQAACKTLLKTLTLLDPKTALSIDLNYRGKLWAWAKQKHVSIEDTMWEVCSRATLISGNETDFRDCLGIKKKPGAAGAAGLAYYKRAAMQCFRRLPKLKYVSVSLRHSHSASENGWSGLLFVKKKTSVSLYKGPKLLITNIVDRIGTGDAMTAGIIHGILSFGTDYQRTVDFALGLSALNHTTLGDASQFGTEDVEHFLKNPGGRVVR